MPKPGPEHSRSDPASNIILQLSEGKHTLERDVFALTRCVYKTGRGKTEVTSKAVFNGVNYQEVPGASFSCWAQGQNFSY